MAIIILKNMIFKIKNYIEGNESRIDTTKEKNHELQINQKKNRE